MKSRRILLNSLEINYTNLSSEATLKYHNDIEKRRWTLHHNLQKNPPDKSYQAKAKKKRWTSFKFFLTNRLFFLFSFYLKKNKFTKLQNKDFIHNRKKISTVKQPQRKKKSQKYILPRIDQRKKEYFFSNPPF